MGEESGSLPSPKTGWMAESGCYFRPARRPRAHGLCPGCSLRPEAPQRETELLSRQRENASRNTTSGGEAPGYFSEIHTRASEIGLDQETGRWALKKRELKARALTEESRNPAASTASPTRNLGSMGSHWVLS